MDTMPQCKNLNRGGISATARARAAAQETVVVRLRSAFDALAACLAARIAAAKRKKPFLRMAFDLLPDSPAYAVVVVSAT